MKQQKDYQIQIQKSKIDEIVKNQQKRERNEARAQVEELQKSLKKLELQKNELQNHYMKLSRQ